MGLAQKRRFPNPSHDARSADRMMVESMNVTRPSICDICSPASSTAFRMAIEASCTAEYCDAPALVYSDSPTPTTAACPNTRLLPAAGVPVVPEHPAFGGAVVGGAE